MIGNKTLFDYVKEDLDKRDALGYSIHGKDLFHTDSNDFLQEAYEESLDQTIYLKGALMRRRARSNEINGKYYKTEKGKLAKHKYKISAKGKIANKRYDSTDKGHERHLRYSRKPERVERSKWQMLSYAKRDKIKAIL